MLNQKHVIAIIYTVALFLDRLDLTIVNVTLPTVANTFAIPIIATDWISMSFLLALAVSIPMSDWLGNKFGYKRIYLLSILLFGLGSTLCAFANNLPQLAILRFIQGIGGGILIPIGMTLIYHVYDRADYSSITSFTFLPSLIAPAIAPFLGGIFLDNFGWRFVYVFSGPITLLLAFFAFLLLNTDVHKKATRLDWLGFVLASAVLSDVFYMLSLISRLGLTALVSLLFVTLIGLLVAFIKHERRCQFPLIDLSYFKNDTFVKANYIQLCFQVCHFGAIFLIGMYLQVGIGMSASMAGLIMGMQAVGAMTTSRYSVRLFNLYGAKLPIIIGMLGIAVLTPCIMLINTPSAILFGCCLFFTRGVFSGLCGTPIQTLSVISLPKTMIGPGNAIFNACRQVSISLGVALSALLIASGLKFYHLTGIDDFGHQHMASVFSFGFWILTLVPAIGILITSYLTDQSNNIDNLIEEKQDGRTCDTSSADRKPIS